eukprot:5537429-Prymnesium_polylepis.1
MARRMLLRGHVMRSTRWRSWLVCCCHSSGPQSFETEAYELILDGYGRLTMDSGPTAQLSWVHGNPQSKSMASVASDTAAAAGSSASTLLHTRGGVRPRTSRCGDACGTRHTRASGAL